jgi:large subunit ribosomal protein L19
MDINTVSQVKLNPNIAQVSPGDTVRVSFRVKEANRERLQTLLGLVVRVRRGTSGGNFTVRRVTYGVGVEHTFPFASPLLQKVEVVRHGKVRRAKLYYIRRLSAKEARLKERREKVVEEIAVGETADEEDRVAEAADDEGTVGEVVVQEDIVEEVATMEDEVEQAAAEETERAE